MEIDWGTGTAIVLTLVVLETVLSFDNAAILTVMSRRLPAGQGRRRALNYGLLIAYGLRILAILGAFLLIQHPILLTVGGAYLLFLFVKHFWGVVRHREHRHKAKEAPVKGMFGFSPLTVIIVQIGLIDLAFALDQVIAAVGFTHYIWLIIVAATIGLISLRLLAPVLSRLMDWLPTLEHMAYVAVGFVGALLILENLPVPTFPTGHIFELHHVPLHPDENIAQALKIGLTLSLFVIPIVIKFFFGVPRSRPHTQTSAARALEAAQPRAMAPKKP